MSARIRTRIDRGQRLGRALQCVQCARASKMALRRNIQVTNELAQIIMKYARLETAHLEKIGTQRNARVGIDQRWLGRAGKEMSQRAAGEQRGISGIESLSDAVANVRELAIAQELGS